MVIAFLMYFVDSGHASGIKLLFTITSFSLILECVERLKFRRTKYNTKAPPPPQKKRTSILAKEAIMKFNGLFFFLGRL